MRFFPELTHTLSGSRRSSRMRRSFYLSLVHKRNTSIFLQDPSTLLYIYFIFLSSSLSISLSIVHPLNILYLFLISVNLTRSVVNRNPFSHLHHFLRSLYPVRSAANYVYIVRRIRREFYSNFHTLRTELIVTRSNWKSDLRSNLRSNLMCDQYSEFRVSFITQISCQKNYSMSNFFYSSSGLKSVFDFDLVTINSPLVR